MQPELLYRRKHRTEGCYRLIRKRYPANCFPESTGAETAGIIPAFLLPERYRMPFGTMSSGYATCAGSIVLLCSPEAGGSGDVTEQAGAGRSTGCLVAGKQVIPRKTRSGYDNSAEVEYIPDSHPIAMRAYRRHTGCRSLIERQRETAVKNGWQAKGVTMQARVAWRKRPRVRQGRTGR